MRISRTLPPLCAVSLWCLLLGGCRTTTALPDREPDITGTITEVTAAQGPEAIGTLRVEENPADSGGSPKYLLTLTHETVLVVRPGEVTEELAFGDMVVGQRVRAWITGPVAESYPMQAAASHVLVLE